MDRNLSSKACSVGSNSHYNKGSSLDDYNKPNSGRHYIPLVDLHRERKRPNLRLALKVINERGQKIWHFVAMNPMS
jgi:hypothetical protein